MTKTSGLWAIWVGTALLLGGCAGSPKAPRPVHVHLHGAVHGSTYTSAEGGFSVPFPVSLEVGGRVLTDDAQSVIFMDNWGSRITFYGQEIAEQSPIMPMLEKNEREKALSDFARHVFGDLITIHYHPQEREGMISFIYLRPASPTTAVAVFIHGRRLYWVQTDLLPGVQLLAQSDEKSQSDRDTWLEGVAVKLAQSIQVK